ncbi:hypothetical protein HYFRA_00010233 [Hymenoscyphus fraxineus]|uniref:Uncharacterized protein n=1 Tax=Hymenoscyphus fraxineus TaxID=746836 RepID=A0A9N9PSJ7_9HELO|nr:hypothetical protein HYFRA_00010233 [Hymenoscyphus fraxineus]
MTDPQSKQEEDVNPSVSGYDESQNNDGGFRPTIKKYSTGNKFRVADSVYISATNGRALQGPYRIATIEAGRTYTLSLADGTMIDNGRAFAERDLEFS